MKAPTEAHEIQTAAGHAPRRRRHAARVQRPPRALAWTACSLLFLFLFQLPPPSQGADLEIWTAPLDIPCILELTHQRTGRRVSAVKEPGQRVTLRNLRTGQYAGRVVALTGVLPAEPATTELFTVLVRTGLNKKAVELSSIGVELGFVFADLDPPVIAPDVELFWGVIERFKGAKGAVPERGFHQVPWLGKGARANEYRGVLLAAKPGRYKVGFVTSKSGKRLQGASVTFTLKEADLQNLGTERQIMAEGKKIHAVYALPYRMENPPPN